MWSVFIMMITHKRVVDEAGNPKEAIIPWEQFIALQEVLGLDFTNEEEPELVSARRDLELENWDAFVDSEEIRRELAQ